MIKELIKMMMVVAVSIWALAGCNDDSSREVSEVPEEAQQLLLEATLSELQSIQADQGDEAVIAQVREMLTQPAYEGIQAPLFQRLLDVVAATRDTDDVLDLYLTFGSDNPALAEAGYRAVMQAVMQSDDPEQQATRLERLIAVPSLPVGVRTSLWQYRMSNYARAGSIADAVDRLDDVLAGDLAANARSIFATAFSQGMKANDYDGVSVFLAALEKRVADQAELNLFLQLSRGELLLAKGQPEAAWDLYRTQRESIGDVQLSRCLVTLLKQVEAQPEVLKQIDEFVYEHGQTYPKTRDAVAAWLVRRAAESGRAADLFAATEKALAHEASVSRIYSGFSRGFYAMAQTAGPDDLKTFSTLLNRMYEAPELHETTRGMIGSARLDVAFFTSDFKAALAIVDAGVPGFDEAWHAELHDKISAHIAQQEGRYDDAVKLYRKHMARVSAWTDPIINPENGQKMIKEVVLGFNEKRIGDIWSSVPGREADAAAAYAKAREWYQKGLALLEEDSAEYKDAEAELAAVPK